QPAASHDAAAIDAEVPDATPDADLTLWPPAGIEVAAIVGGDFDGDGTGDLVIASVGAEPGLYLLRGGVDLDVTADPIATHFSAFRALAMTAPVSLAAVEVDAAAGSDVAVSYVSGGDVRLAVLRGSDLELLNDVASGIPTPPAGRDGWLATTVFGTMDRLIVDSDGDTRHVAPVDLLDASPMLGLIPPEAPATRWTQPQTVFAYGQGTVEVVMVTSTQILVSDLPTAPPPGGMFAFTILRDGMPWLGQVPLDLDADGVPEVLGFSPEGGNPGKVCGYSVTGAVATTCLDTTVPDDEDVVMLAAQLTPDADPELAVVHTGDTVSTLTIIPKVTMTGATLAADPVPPVADVTIPDALVAISDLAGSGRGQVALVGTGGEIVCRTLGMTGIRDCAPP
ncbi:MAG: hypothetical protein KC464_27605, partial [Myxococcales bacterium]|nr:hypothetical protein [Myxococcales bacterium]